MDRSPLLQDPRTPFHRLLAETLAADGVAAAAFVPMACGGVFTWGGGGIVVPVAAAWLTIHLLAAIVLLGRGRLAIADGLLDAASLGIAFAAYLAPPALTVIWFTFALHWDPPPTADARVMATMTLGFIFVGELMFYGCVALIFSAPFYASRRVITAIVAAPLFLLILVGQSHLRSAKRIKLERHRLVDLGHRAKRINADGPIGRHGWSNGRYCAEFEIDLSMLSAHERAEISIDAVAGAPYGGEVRHFSVPGDLPTRPLEVCWIPRDVSRERGTIEIRAWDLTGRLSLAPWSIGAFDVPPFED